VSGSVLDAGRLVAGTDRQKSPHAALLAVAQWWVRPTIVKKTRPATITPVQRMNPVRMAAA
jgi:hypothetical protein